MKEISGSKNSKAFIWALRGVAIFGVVSLLAILLTYFLYGSRSGAVGNTRSPKDQAAIFTQHLDEVARRMALYEKSADLAERYEKGDGVLKDFKLASETRETSVQLGQSAAFALRAAATSARTAVQVQAVINLCKADRRLSDDRLLGKCYLKAAILGVPGAADTLAEEIGKPGTNLSAPQGEPAPLLKRWRANEPETPIYPIFLYGLLNVCAAKTHHLKCAKYRDELFEAGSLSEVRGQAFSRELMADIEAELK